MKGRIRNILWLLIPAVLILNGSVQAQFLPEPAGSDSIRQALVPVAGYSSDIGLMGGVLYSRYDYTGNVRPFNNYIKSTAVTSTKGFVKVEGLYEQTETFGRDIRSSYQLFFNRLANNNFFGIGNNTSYSEQLWDNEYYFFESINLSLDLAFRKPLYNDLDSRFDLLIGLGMSYQIPYVRQANSSFNRRMPNGSKGGFVNYLSGGFVWENRDNEFDPKSGNRVQLKIRMAPKFASEYGLTVFRLDLRQYFYVFDFLTIANRLEARHAAGNIPYWELSTLGDDYSLRGYPLNRFQGNSSLSFNLELRSWMFTFPEYAVKIGVHFFTDAGRVFTGEDDAADLLKGYKQTIGLGGALSLFNPDFILRGEMGFSEDVSRIYVGIGYTF
ncbi:MAG: BamA/TamA family outer membrane protein [Balneolaceae bacterium]|nr:BamA/TamA family outer membrane protein [Balneolaceae bacterium]